MIRNSNILNWHISFIAIAMILNSCAINIELTSQRTALEKQMLGEYKDYPDELYMISTIRDLNDHDDLKEKEKKKFEKAKMNRIFNLDDLEELKKGQIIGERSDGKIAILPTNLGLVGKAPKEKLKLANLLVKEENLDRETIWAYTIENNPNLTEDNYDQLKKTYATQQKIQAKPGYWVQNDNGQWQQISVEKKQQEPSDAP